jgi:hypothetical protein
MLNYIEENNALYEICNNCGHKDVSHDRIIESTIYKISNKNIGNNNYIRYDPTLPRTIHKECPNDECPSRKDKKMQEAVFYPDKLTMKLIYICIVCNTQWQYS